MGRKIGCFLIVSIMLFSAGLLIFSSRTVTTNNYVETLDKHDPIKVMTFNIRGGRDNERNVQLDALIGEIQYANPDIVGLQEVDICLPRSGFKNQIEYISKQLHMNYVFFPTINFVIGAYGDAILSKFPIESYKGYRLPSGFEPRGIIEARVKYDEQEISIYSTHFGLGDLERQKQFSYLKDILQQNAGAKIVLGDFNTRPTEYKLINFKEQMVDSSQMSQKSIVTIPILKTQLDYVLFSHQFKELGLYTGQSKVSDHNPVVCILALN